SNDQQRHGGDFARERPCRRDARGPDHRHPGTARLHGTKRDAARRWKNHSRSEAGFRMMKKELGIFVLLLVLCGVTTAENPRFLSHANLINTSNIIGLFGIFSIGLGMVIITGGIDLSVGSMLALNGMLLAMALTEWHWPWPLAALFALAVPMV